MRKTILLLIIFLNLSISTVLADFDAEHRSITHNGIERHYYLYTPDTEINQLLIVLHPSGSNGRAMQYVTGLNSFADSQGFAIAYPDASDYFWDDGRVEAGMPPEIEQVDDAGFITTLADSLSAGLNLEEVYLTGLENGATMAYRIACEAPEQFEAIIPVAAMMWEYHLNTCADASAPVNILMITGAEHPQYIPQGEDVEFLATGVIFAWLGWQDTVNIWRERNNCPDSDTSVTDNSLTVYTGCEEDTEVAFLPIPVAGYNWTRMAENTINRFGTDTSAIIASYISGENWQSLTEPQSATTELARSWIVYVPSTYDENSPAPLILNLHGRLSNAALQAYTSDFNRIAEREGFIVLYPNGIDTAWNYFRGVFIPDEKKHDDEAFIRSLIDDLDVDLNIDRNRMYVTGLSNGGFMTQRLACTMQDEFVAFATVAATAPFAIEQLCVNATPVPILYIHGTADNNVPWNGDVRQNSVGRSFYISYPMNESFGFWGFHNQCSQELESERLPVVDPETTTLLVTAQDCADNSTVILYGVSGGGHVWHGTRTDENDFLGENSQDFNSSEVIWEFFSKYSLDQRIED